MQNKHHWRQVSRYQREPYFGIPPVYDNSNVKAMKFEDPFSDYKIWRMLDIENWNLKQKNFVEYSFQAQFYEGEKNIKNLKNHMIKYEYGIGNWEEEQIQPIITFIAQTEDNLNELQIFLTHENQTYQLQKVVLFPYQANSQSNKVFFEVSLILFSDDTYQVKIDNVLNAEGKVREDFVTEVSYKWEQVKEMKGCKYNDTKYNEIRDKYCKNDELCYLKLEYQFEIAGLIPDACNEIQKDFSKSQRGQQQSNWKFWDALQDQNINKLLISCDIPQKNQYVISTTNLQISTE